MGFDGVNAFDGKHWLLCLSLSCTSKALPLLDGGNAWSFGLSCLIRKINERNAKEVIYVHLGGHILWPSKFMVFNELVGYMSMDVELLWMNLEVYTHRYMRCMKSVFKELFEGFTKLLG